MYVPETYFPQKWGKEIVQEVVGQWKGNELQG